MSIHQAPIPGHDKAKPVRVTPLGSTNDGRRLVSPAGKAANGLESEERKVKHILPEV
jgi:hypothetical protein